MCNTQICDWVIPEFGRFVFYWRNGIMPPRLADRLSAGRRRRFIGRNAELQLFEAALVSDEPPYFVLFVYGPGGVGKSTLLGQYARLCSEHQAHAYTIDARNIEAFPEAFLAALALAMGLRPDESRSRPCSLGAGGT